MPKNRDLESLIDIAFYGRQALAFVGDFTQDEFERDGKTQAAVMYAIAIMGEATKRLSQDFRLQYPLIPWQEIAGIRDRLVHDYKNIDLDILWQVVSVEIPSLLVSLEPLLPEEDGD
ncbi:MAG: DUF86 domain-containing protein [Coleofasciculaceae cyanobacterium SM2_1_6]|nr:DUF86 domain-containing protein [Coleofasciculaceae cyanobacterium SM2_1_6]